MYRSDFAQNSYWPALKIRLYLATVALFLICCRQNSIKPVPSSNWTEAQKRNYFVDSFAYFIGLERYSKTVENDSTRSFAYFFRHHYPNVHTSYYMDPLPYALEEEYIDTISIDSNRQWARFIVNSFFELPYSLVLEKKAGRTYLIAKLTDGRGLYFPGQLILTSKQQVSDSLSNAVFKTLDSLNFWNLKPDTPCLGWTDGSEWTIEAIAQHKYHAIHRRIPEGCGDSATRQIARIVNKLATICELDTLVRACDNRRKGIFKVRK